MNIRFLLNCNFISTSNTCDLFILCVHRIFIWKKFFCRSQSSLRCQWSSKIQSLNTESSSSWNSVEKILIQKFNCFQNGSDLCVIFCDLILSIKKIFYQKIFVFFSCFFSVNVSNLVPSLNLEMTEQNDINADSNDQQLNYRGPKW